MSAEDAEKLVTESIVWLNTRTLDLPTAIQLGGWVAAKVNTIKGLKGLEKQALVCRVVEAVVKRAVPEDAAPVGRDALLEALKVALPAALTLAVDAANGRLSLKKVSPSCFARGLLCFARAAVDVAVVAKVVDPVKAEKVEAVLEMAEKAVPEQILTNQESQSPEKTEQKEEETPATQTDEEPQKEEVRVEFP